jgi:ribosomal protein L19
MKMFKSLTTLALSLFMALTLVVVVQGEERGEHGGKKINKEKREGHGSRERGEHAREGGSKEKGEESGTQYSIKQKYDQVRNGARLILSYDKKSNSFKGVVINTTKKTLERVRVEVHLSNGTELGPTKPGNLKPGQKRNITLKATKKPFERWNAHPEVGNEEGHSSEKGEGREGSERGGKKINKEKREGHGSRERGEHAREGGSKEKGEESGTQYSIKQKYDQVRNGARLILSYDKKSNSFKGVVINTTKKTLERVRVEVHLSNGTELGPTKPGNLKPGQKRNITLKATKKPFERWNAHPEVGNEEGHGSEKGEGREGSERGGEGHGKEGREGGERGGEGHGEEGGLESLMSSPVTPITKVWSGNLGGLKVTGSYNLAAKSLKTVVTNTLSKKLGYVQTEPHLKKGSRTVAEMGPGMIGHLNPGQTKTLVLFIADEPELKGIVFDGYKMHMEVYAADGPGPKGGASTINPLTGLSAPSEGGERGHGSEKGEGREGGSKEKGEESGTQYSIKQKYDQVRNGARLILSYDKKSNSFKGVVINTTRKTLERVRVEVHLSNGTELGPTKPGDLKPGAKRAITLKATKKPFERWNAHPEVGNEEGHSSEKGEGREGRGEHGGKKSREGRGEHK